MHSNLMLLQFRTMVNSIFSIIIIFNDRFSVELIIDTREVCKQIHQILYRFSGRSWNLVILDVKFLTRPAMTNAIYTYVLLFSALLLS